MLDESSDTSEGECDVGDEFVQIKTKPSAQLNSYHSQKVFHKPLFNKKPLESKKLTSIEVEMPVYLQTETDSMFKEEDDSMIAGHI